jgi:hypothetical protein
MFTYTCGAFVANKWEYNNSNIYPHFTSLGRDINLSIYSAIISMMMVVVVCVCGGKQTGNSEREK